MKRSLTIPFDERVRPVARSLGYSSETQMSWDGSVQDLDIGRIKFVKASTGFPTIVGQAGQQIYEAYYSRGETNALAPATQISTHRTSAMSRGQAPRVSPLLEDAFVGYLAASNKSAASWQSGWRLIAREPHVLVARGDDPPLQIPKESFRELHEGEGCIRVEKGSAKLQEGWYYARGENDHSPDRVSTIRVYWSISRYGAGPLLEALTSTLNQAEVPFRVKVLSDLNSYTRADAGVLYLPREMWSASEDALATAYHVVRRYLYPTTPALTLPIGYGVGIADDPGRGESFGSSRSRLIAEGLWLAHARGLTSDTDRLTAMKTHFASQGIDPERPHLSPGNAEIQAWLPDLAPTNLSKVTAHV